jgi:predicted phosphodiesterase
MRLSLLSDVHANVHALEAVLDDITARNSDADVYHIGDLVGYAAYPNETVALIEENRVPGVAGNYDSTVARDAEHCGCKYEDPEQERLSHLSYGWTLANVDTGTRQTLARLPFRMDLRVGGGHKPGARVILVHGTPKLNTVYWHADRTDDFCRKMAAGAGARPGDVIAFGHTHVPWTREIDGIHFLNTGSVGRPKDGDWRAGYVDVDLSSGTPEIHFHRVEYDLDAAMQGIRDSTLPDFFADYLAAGGTPSPETTGHSRSGSPDA